MNFRPLAVPLLLVACSLIVNAEQTKKPKITMEQARATASAEAPGTIKSAELEKEHGKLVYSFDIATAGGIREIQVDANSGEIVSNEMESAADEAKEAAHEKKQGKSHKKSENVTSTQNPK